MSDSCARLLGFNNVKSFFPVTLARGVADRLNTIGDDLATTNSDVAITEAVHTSQMLSAGVRPGKNGDYLPGVPRWSLDELTDRLNKFTTAANTYAERLQAGLSANEADEIRLGILSQLADNLDSKLDMNSFQIQQTMQEMDRYSASIDLFAAEQMQFSKEFTSALDNWKHEVRRHKAWEITEVAFACLDAVVEGCDIAVHYRKCQSSASATEEAKKEHRKLAILEGMSTMLDGLQASYLLIKMSIDASELGDSSDAVDKASLVPDSLPKTQGDLSEFLDAVRRGELKPSFYTAETREQLLNISNYNVSGISLGQIAYDNMADNFHAMLVPAISAKILTTEKLDAIMVKIAMSGKAGIGAIAGYTAAQATFAKQMWSIISDAKNVQEIRKAKDDLEKQQLNKKPNFVNAAYPGFKSFSDSLWDLLDNICNAYYYAAGEPCASLETVTRDAYSMENMKRYISSIVAAMNKLKKASPQDMAAFDNAATPIVIDATNEGGQEVLESLKTEYSVYVNSTWFKQNPLLKSLRVVCMDTSAIELVGAKPGPGGNSHVEVYMLSAGSNVMQRMKDGSELFFQTPSIELMSKYVAGGNRDGKHPAWEVAGKMLDAEKYFCRSPFQDMRLRIVLQDIDLSEVSQIKIYVSGYGLPSRSKMQDSHRPWQSSDTYDWTKEVSSGKKQRPWENEN
jgi:hypothetical protein